MMNLPNLDLLTLIFYATIAYASLYFFYIAFANTRWEDLDIELLRRLDLRLGHLLLLLEAPDVMAMSGNRSDRRRLFPSMAGFLLMDVIGVLRARPRLPTILLGGLFLFGYGLIRIKSLLGWGRHDLHFLAGLELAVARSLAKDG